VRERRKTNEREEKQKREKISSFFCSEEKYD
jgi:hypothetical protein